MEQRIILVNLLVKLGVAASAASILGRSVEFKSLLFREERSLKHRIYLVLWIGIPMATGVWIRFTQPSFLAGDLSFETTVLLGVIAGRATGMLGGALLALPALLHGEWATLPFNLLCGFIAGQLRVIAPDREDIWAFSRLLPHATFSLESPKPWVEALIYATSIMVIGTELKIWNSVRIQIKLEEQERLLLLARMEALQNQINPHFLFNALNSVSSLVRFDPDTARELIIKLANILRRLLHSSDAFVPLREELEFIDNYLDIEVVRFGRDKLRVVKELDTPSLETMVPSMLLQPLVENSIKHGLASKIEGGSIYVRSRLTDSHLIIEVEDNGVGMGSANLLERPTGLGGTGIGMANVAERLKVLYGDTARMTIDSHEGEGTLVRQRLPVPPSGSAIPAVGSVKPSNNRP